MILTSMVKALTTSAAFALLQVKLTNFLTRLLSYIRLIGQ